MSLPPDPEEPPAIDGDEPPADARVADEPTAEKREHPLVFISYSWTSPEHKQWVRDLAAELRTVWRLDIRLDKWHLRDGEDAPHFMERMIAEADKVLIVSDCEYARKANAREGGAGIEAQILTPELYAQVAGDDTDGPLPKFAVAVTEPGDDGKACRPRFYGGRQYIDITDLSRYAEKVRDIALWAYDRQEEEPPPIGGSPDFLEEGPTTGTYAAAGAARRALDAGRPEGLRLAETYFDRLASGLVAFVPTGSTDAAAAAAAVEAARSLTPVYEEAAAVLVALARSRGGRSAHRAVRGLFTSLAPYVLDHETLGQNLRPSRWQRDPFRAFVPDLFLAAVAAFLDADDAEGVAALTTAPYAPEVESRDARRLYFPMLQPGIDSPSLRQPIQNVSEGRTDPLGALKLAQADLVLLLASARLEGGVAAFDRDRWSLWYPYALLSHTLYYRAGALPLFTEAESRVNLDRIATAVGTEADGLLDLIGQFVEADAAGAPRVPDVGYKQLTGLARLGTNP